MLFPEVRLQNKIISPIPENEATGIDADAYVAKITRMKPTPAFDSLSLNSPENEEFGDENVFARHFTRFSAEHSKVMERWPRRDRSACSIPPGLSEPVILQRAADQVLRLL